ncbi:alpha/beta hydrolase [Priestia megaterium]|uniref:alpha/beta hydrolase n=1 Tax=Priestia megaterium TaxID=1404 RepID=UPI0036DCD660
MPINPLLKPFAKDPVLSINDPEHAIKNLRREKDLLTPFYTQHITFKDIKIELNNKIISARVYTPKHLLTEETEALVFFHGGGFVKGSIETHNTICYNLSNFCNFRIISIEYSLAPEHPYPYAIKEGLEVVKWIFKNTFELKINPKRISIGGDSAGGNLATVISLMNRDGLKLPLYKQVLIYPVVSYSSTIVSTSLPFEKHNNYGLSKDMMNFFWKCYVGNYKELDDYLISPIQSKTLKDLPQALIITVEYDILRNEAESYAYRLREYKNRTELKCFKGLIHGSLNYLNVDVPEIKEVYKTISEFLINA